jgi:hypothetical protein
MPPAPPLNPRTAGHPDDANYVSIDPNITVPISLIDRFTHGRRWTDMGIKFEDTSLFSKQLSPLFNVKLPDSWTTKSERGTRYTVIIDNENVDRIKFFFLEGCGPCCMFYKVDFLQQETTVDTTSDTTSDTTDDTTIQ